jgi:endonuclease/exonuclease/phosphatase (EEP) superfamily protein YafD
VGWAVVVPLLGVAAARVVAWDSHSTLVALNALTPFLFLPAWPVAVVAGLSRRWALLGIAVVVVIAHAAFMAPELAAREPLPAVPREVRHLRLFNANVLFVNPDVTGIAREIAAAAPDVVFLQEATPALAAAVEATGVLDELPHRVAVARTDPAAALLASRFPLLDHDIMKIGGQVLIRATLDPGWGPLRLYAVHTPSPVGAGRRPWAEALRAVAREVRKERLPVVVAGDFNATWNHRAFRQLLDTGLTDGAAARGRPFQLTWPRDRRLLPPLVRIDHVLTGPGLAVTAIRTGRGEGSDHRPVVADIAPTG